KSANRVEASVATHAGAGVIGGVGPTSRGTTENCSLLPRSSWEAPTAETLPSRIPRPRSPNGREPSGANRRCRLTGRDKRVAHAELSLRPEVTKQCSVLHEFPNPTDVRRTTHLCVPTLVPIQHTN